MPRTTGRPSGQGPAGEGVGAGRDRGDVSGEPVSAGDLSAGFQRGVRPATEVGPSGVRAAGAGHGPGRDPVRVARADRGPGQLCPVRGDDAAVAIGSASAALLQGAGESPPAHGQQAVGVAGPPVAGALRRGRATHR